MFNIIYNWCSYRGLCRIMRAIFITIVCVIGFIALMFLLQLGGLVNYKFFATKYENARREVYEETKSYNDGVVRELQNFMIEYYTHDEVGKQALKSVILHRAADYPTERLPKDVQRFINKLKGQ